MGKDKRKSLPEAKEQAELARVLTLTARAERAAGRPFLWTHVAGERESRRETMILRQLGVKPGVPDVLIFAPAPPGYVGVALELKRTDGRPSDLATEQRAWLRTLKDAGWWTGWARGAADAIRQLRTLGYPLGTELTNAAETE